MSAILLDGKSLAQRIKEALKNKIINPITQKTRPPSLTVVLVGNDPASEIYVRNKQQACHEVGIHSNIIRQAQNTTEDALLKLIDQLNQYPNIDGILVQLPLPPHIDKYRILEALDPYKDVDGLHPYNLGRLTQGQPLFRACTPYGIMCLLEETFKSAPVNMELLNKLLEKPEFCLRSRRIEDEKRSDLEGREHLRQGFDAEIEQKAQFFTLVGLHAVIVGASDIVGKPMGLELLQAGCTVTLCHQYTRDLKQHVQQADLLISAIGKPNIIQSDWIKPNAIVVDVGINRLKNNTITGDIQFDTAKMRAGAITPVPGGVGPMTVAMLLSNTYLAQQLKFEK